MTNFIPIFPLNIVAYPGEQLNLHIFEPRYKQMVRECVADKKPFGLPPVLNDRMGEIGTLIHIREVAREYEDGRMDVRTEGSDVFRILQVIDSVPDRLFSGAIVNYPPNQTDAGDTTLARNVTGEVRRLFDLLSVSDKFPQREGVPLSYQLAHFVGFKPEEEYEMLGLFTELYRLEYIRRHLTRLLPMVQELEEMKKRIARNGHFRELSLGDLGIS